MFRLWLLSCIADRMDSGLYAACSGLVARTQALDVAANNLANVNTTGYLGQQELFREVLATKGDRNLSSINLAVNSFGVLGGSHIDIAQGQLSRTGNQLDLGIEGRGFFPVETAAGLQYTRDGNFHVASGGTLVTSSGDAVQGVQGPIRIPDGEVAISADGSISVNGALAGKLRLVDFAPGTPLAASGSGYYTSPKSSEIPSQAQVHQGLLESSNVNPVATAVGLIALQRHAEMLQRALTTFHSEFNRIAAEDLPKV